MLIYDLTRADYLELLDNLGDRWVDGDPTAINWEHDNPNAYQYRVV